MKILVDGRLYGLENAGLGRYLINLVAELGKIDSKNEYVILLRKKYFDSLNLPNNWQKVLVDFRHYSMTEQFLLPGIIKKENPDLVHFPHFNVPVFYRGKYVVTIHDMLMHKSVGLAATTLPAPLYIIRRLGYRFVFDKAIRSAEKIVVPSKSVKDELLKFYKVSERKISVTYEGFDEKISGRAESAVSKPYFVYTGNAYPHKNLKRLIEAMIFLNTKFNQSVNLAIASSRGIFTQRLERIIRDEKAEKYVKLLGFVPDDKLYGIYKNSVGYISPSLSEGFGLPGLEAMSAGTLVLASEIPVFKEIYSENATYFNPFDFSSIEKAMEKALEMDRTERETKINRAKDFVKRYSWAKMAKETLKIYEDSFGIRSGK